MRIAKCVHKFTGFQSGHLGHHQGEQGVGGDVEGHTQENVGAALVHLAGQGAVVHVELEECMAGCERHFVDLTGVPGADDQAARVRVGLDLFNDAGNLVYGRTIRRRPGAPLHSVHRAQFAVFIGPLVPDGDSMVAQVAYVRFSLKKPQQFVDDGLEMQFLGGQRRERPAQVEAHLVAEDTQRAGAGAVRFRCALVAHVA